MNHTGIVHSRLTPKEPASGAPKEPDWEGTLAHSQICGLRYFAPHKKEVLRLHRRLERLAVARVIPPKGQDLKSRLLKGETRWPKKGPGDTRRPRWGWLYSEVYYSDALAEKLRRGDRSFLYTRDLEEPGARMARVVSYFHRCLGGWAASARLASGEKAKDHFGEPANLWCAGAGAHLEDDQLWNTYGNTLWVRGTAPVPILPVTGLRDDDDRYGHFLEAPYATAEDYYVADAEAVERVVSGRETFGLDPRSSEYHKFVDAWLDWALKRAMSPLAHL